MHGSGEGGLVECGGGSMVIVSGSTCMVVNSSRCGGDGVLWWWDGVGVAGDEW